MDIRDEIIAQARARQGIPYRLDPPPDGVHTLDCSLFVLQVVKAAGVPLSGVRTAEQIRQATVPIPFSAVLPGDLLYFENTYDAAGPAGPDGRIASHIGISLGAGTRRMWDANSVNGVGETNIGTAYWQSKLFEARRLPQLVNAVPEPSAVTADPWQWFSAEQIAEITNCPAANVTANWPRLVEQLAHCGINTRPTQIAMIATVAIESARTFAPVREAFWLDEAWRANNLTYYPFYGRGYIQLTHRSNYERYGPKVAELWGTSPDQPDFDLVGDPDRALDPDISAAVSALYFRDHGGDGDALIPEAAAAQDWREVRRLVQGGAAGLAELTEMATALWALPMPGEHQEPPIVLPSPFDRAAAAARLRAIMTLHDQYDAAMRAEFATLLAMLEAA